MDAGESQCPGQGGAGPGATGADARALHRHQAHPSPSDQELGRPHLRRRGVRAGTIAAPAPSPPRRLRPPVPPPPAPSRPPLLRPAPELCGLLRPLPTDLRRTRSILWGNPGRIPARINRGRKKRLSGLSRDGEGGEGAPTLGDRLGGGVARTGFHPRQFRHAAGGAVGPSGGGERKK